MGKYLAPALFTAACILIVIVAVRVNTDLHWLNYVGFVVMAGLAGWMWWRACRDGASC